MNKWKYKGYGFDGAFHQTNKIEIHDRSPIDLSTINETWYENPDLIDDAVISAKVTQKKWSRLSLTQRIDKFLSFHKEIEKRSDMLALAICSSTGKTINESKSEIQAVLRKNRLTIEKGLELVKTVCVNGGQYEYHPLGVIAIIGPFNFPLHLVNSHVAPALLLGNSVVIKGSEDCPLVTQIYYEAALASKLPPGLLCIVQGGAATGKALVCHKDTKGIIFTGSYEVGLKIKKQCLEMPDKLIALEMGGKNFCLIDKGSDIKLAAKEISAASLGGAGQKCSATSRVLAHHSIADELLNLIKDEFNKVNFIDPRSEKALMSTLVNETAVNNFLKYQNQIYEDTNSQIICKGQRLSKNNCFVKPALRLVMDQNNPLFFKEVFAPDLSFEAVSDYEQALSIINDNPYGLCLSYFAENSNKYRHFINNTRAGIYNFNKGTTGASGEMPFGGTGMSGNFRPAGIFSPLYCSYPKSIGYQHIKDKP